MGLHVHVWVMGFYPYSIYAIRDTLVTESNVYVFNGRAYSKHFEH